MDCGRLIVGWRHAALILAAAPALAQPNFDVPYVPTPQVVVDEMLRLAEVSPSDYLIDLGSGDGRIVIAAAKRFGARGYGVDLDGTLVNNARREAQRQGVAGRVEFHARNLFFTDIERASVLTLYLYPRVLMQLRPRLVAELKPGTRVVSHDFDLGSWRPDAHVTVAVPDKPHGPPSSEVYLWIVPANAAGTWQWRLAHGGAVVDYELALQQTFQVVEGSARVGGRAGRLEGGKMRGEEIRFILTADVSGRALRHEFSGRVSGDAVAGAVKLPGGGDLDWQGVRTRRGSIEIQ